MAKLPLDSKKPSKHKHWGLFGAGKLWDFLLSKQYFAYKINQITTISHSSKPLLLCKTFLNLISISTQHSSNCFLFSRNWFLTFYAFVFYVYYHFLPHFLRIYIYINFQNSNYTITYYPAIAFFVPTAMCCYPRFKALRYPKVKKWQSELSLDSANVFRLWSDAIEK